jgi:uncharacterized protein YndB with AHSA1/START domain
MADSRFVYVTYIRTTVDRLWQALREPEFTRRFWLGMYQESTWKPGATWSMHFPDGRMSDSGEVLEAEPPRLLVLRWRNEFRPNLKAEGYSRMTYLLEPQDDLVKLTITHEIDRPDSEFIQAVSGGWPMVVASLKSLLETGEPLSNIKRPCAEAD